MGKEDEHEGIAKGKGTDLVITVFNKLTNETITMDAADEGEQFILTMGKAKANSLFLAKSCSPKLLIDHLMNIAEENKEEFMVAFMIATTTGVIDKNAFKNIKVHAIAIGGDDDETPDLPSFGDDKKKTPTFN